MELYINNFSPVATQVAFNLCFDATDDFNQSYRVVIPTEYFSDFLDCDLEGKSFQDIELDGTDWLDHAATIIEGHENGKHEDIIVKRLNVTGYKFHKKEGSRSVCAKYVGCPVAFMQKEPSYTSFEPIYS